MRPAGWKKEKKGHKDGQERSNEKKSAIGYCNESSHNFKHEVVTIQGCENTSVKIQRGENNI